METAENMVEAPRNTILQGDALLRLRELPDECVQTVVTSPPYWALRDYGTAHWDGGDPACDHAVRTAETRAKQIISSSLEGAKTTVGHAQEGHRARCPRCGARRIDTQLGLEPTLAEYITRMVEVFREVKRVLRKDGTAWVNMGDSFSTGVASDVTDCLDRRIKGQPLIFGNAATIGITGKRRHISLHDERTPDGILLRLLGVERVTIKQRNNDFCQVLHTLNSDCYCWITAPLSAAHRNATDLELIMDVMDDLSIVVSEHDTNGEPVFGILRAPSRGPSKGDNAALPVKEAAKPVTEWIADGETIGDAVAFDAPLKRLPDVYMVDQSIALRDGFHSPAGLCSDFRVTQASKQQLTLSLGSGGGNLRAVNVAHLFTPNIFGSLVRYSESYHNAIGDASESQAKQQLGVPELLKRALMRNGWICRATIVWHKSNPMPESATDRPTTSHEYIFLLSKRANYYYDAEAIQEPVTGGSHPHAAGRNSRKYVDRDPAHIYTKMPDGWDTGKGAHGSFHRQGREKGRRVEIVPGVTPKSAPAGSGIKADESFHAATTELVFTRNKRSVWTVATKPFNGANILADYVGADGKPYRVSEDCPVHGPHRASRTRHRSGYDARQDASALHSPDTSSSPVLLQRSAAAATDSHTHDGRQYSDSTSAVEQTPQSISESRNGAAADSVGSRSHRRNTRTSQTDASSSDSLGLWSAETATLHSMESHRTDLALATSPAYSASAETDDRTGDTSAIPDSADSADHNAVSNSAQDGSGGHPSGQTQRHSGRKSLLPYTHGNVARCTCQIISTDHFATFPPALIEPCILAGSRPGDLVLDPFMGSGTTAVVAVKHLRDYLGIELNPVYIAMANRRLGRVQTSFLSLVV